MCARVSHVLLEVMHYVLVGKSFVVENWKYPNPPPPAQREVENLIKIAHHEFLSKYQKHIRAHVISLFENTSN